MARLLVWVAVVCVAVGARVVLGATDSQDVNALRSLMSEWQNTPPNWGRSDDPCGTSTWDGITCADSRVIILQLSSMNLKGTLSTDIGLLTGLQILDLSSNKELGGQLTPNIGNLKKLRTLILAGCSFNGNIPQELGSLPLLSYLALNTNAFIGNIPVSLGALSNLYWFDISENNLTGTLPVSSGNTPGLDRLFICKHFHFNKNQLSGSIPSEIFNANMTLIHILFDGNQFTGKIPETIGLVATVEVLRLDRNRLEGPIPGSINNLTSIMELHLANNRLTGNIPNLSGLNNLNYLDIGNNAFTPSTFPNWLTTLRALTTLDLQSSSLEGSLPGKLFALPQLQKILLKNNTFNGTLDLSSAVGQQLDLVNLENNNISTLTLGASSSVTVVLSGNPICNSIKPNRNFCQLQQEQSYSTSLGGCASTTCSDGQSITPVSCNCAYPYQGQMTFRAPGFSDLTNSTRFQLLETSLWTKLGLSENSVTLQNLVFTDSNYIQLLLSLFPSPGMYFDRVEVQKLGFDLSNQTYKPPAEFGTYLFIAFPYPFSDGSNGKSLSAAAVAGIVVACTVLLIGLVVLGLYAFRQQRRAKKAQAIANPFASWVTTDGDAGDAPQLKGTRSFFFEDISKITNGFFQGNEIGVGGYGKVYKGTLGDGQVVAIKRAQKGSMQGALEFKMEIELLSRVHHRNLVNLVGFCYDKGEQMLVYEYIPNGTLRDNLTRKTGITLDWKRRLKIALGSARGLAYLHELADPPIIHRDVKSVNILLDDTLTAKVADFGLSKLVSDNEKDPVSTEVKGTLGYLDPEYYMTHVLTEKSDVYSFGVVMLELITSRPPIERGKYMVKEIRTALDWNDQLHCGLTKIMDPVLADMQVQHMGFSRFLNLALKCVEESTQRRPRMNEVVKEIEAILEEGEDATSAPLSATDLWKPNKPPHHPYDEALQSGNASSNSSMGYMFSLTIQPK